MKNPAVRILLLGFLVAAAVLLARGPSTGDEAHRIVVRGSDLAQLKAGYERTWMREPTAVELRGELVRYIRQEVLYREALDRGYDRDDMVVRRAMQQKMEFLAQSMATREQPSDDEFQAFFSLRQERYRLPAVLSLDQVYLNPELHGGDVEQVAAALLERLRREQPGREVLIGLGDPIMLDTHYSGFTEQDLARTFGEDFGPAVIAQPLGEWSGPISSGFGLHLVRVSERQASRIPEWSEVAAKVLTDMDYEARQASREQLYQEIAQKYQIIFDRTVRNLLDGLSE